MSAGEGSAARWAGFDLHVEDVGAGRPVVLLHSSGMSGDQWRRTSAAVVASGRRAVVPDLLGSGRSVPWPDGEPFTFERDVEVVDRLLDRVAEPVHLVGHSYGGHVALRVATLAGSRVRSLALYDPVAFGVLDPEADERGLEEVRSLAFDWGTTEDEHVHWLRAFVEYWGGSEAWERLRPAAREEMRRVGWLVFAGAQSLMRDQTGVEAYMGIDAPTLLVTGERSPLAARGIVARLGARMQHARVERFGGAGHMGPLTHLDAWNAVLTEHLAAAERG